MAVSRDWCHVAAGRLERGPGLMLTRRAWPYTEHWKHLRRCTDEALVDPMNVHVDGAGPDAVMRALAPRGWGPPDGGGGVHRAWLGAWPRFMSGQIALGTHEERFHLRVWGFAEGTLGAAHHEVLGANDQHIVTSWDAARARVVGDLAAFGWARAEPGEVLAKPRVRGLDGDGRVWRVVAA
jgi:hypothetical protein